MKFAILSDIHGNLEALSAILEDLDRHSIRKVLFLGDAVGYGADPIACWKLIEQKADIRIAGNHDVVAATITEIDDFEKDNTSSIRWTNRKLDTHTKKRITTLDLEYVENEMHCVHGSPFQPENWHYIMTDKDAERGFANSSAQLIFVGHSHVPSVFVELEHRRFFGGETRTVREIEPSNIKLKKRYRYIINSGSVGQPRDNNPRAAYGIYDPDANTFTLYRVKYDIEKAAKKIRAAGLPDEMAERLKWGR